LSTRSDQPEPIPRRTLPSGPLRAPLQLMQNLANSRCTVFDGAACPSRRLLPFLPVRRDFSTVKIHPTFVRRPVGGMPGFLAALDSRTDKTRDFCPLNGDRASDQKSDPRSHSSAAWSGGRVRQLTSGTRKFPAPRIATSDPDATSRRRPNPHAACGVRTCPRLASPASFAANPLASAPRPALATMLATRRGRPRGRRRLSPCPRSQEGYGT